MSAGVIEYSLRIDTAKGTAKLKNVSGALDDVGVVGSRSAKKAGGALDGLGMKVLNLNQLLELSQKAFRLLSTPIEKIISIGSKFEDLRLQLDTVLQSAAKGEEYFEWIKKFSSTTPFRVEGLTQAVIMLENFGVNAKKHLRTFGDASAGLNVPLTELSKVMGQIWVKPSAQMEEMLQLAERGVPVFDILEEQLGLTAEQVAEIGRQGISGQKVFEALARGMDERFGGASEKMAKTWSGMMSTLSDKFDLFLGTVAGPVLESLKEKLDGLLSKVDQWAKDGTLEQVAEKISSFITGVISTISDIVKTIIKWKDAIIFAGKAWLLYFSVSKLNAWGGAFQSVITGVGGKFSGLGKSFSNLGRMFERLRARGHGFFTSLSGSLTQISPRIRGIRGQTGLLQTGLKNIGAVGAAAFAGWQLGKWIGKVTGLNKTVSDVFETLLTRSQEYYDKRSAMTNMTAEQRDMTAMIDQTRRIAKAYGITERNLVKMYLAIRENKAAYAQVTPEMRSYIESIYEKRKAAESAQKAQEALKKSTTDHGKATAAAVVIEGKYLALMQQYNIKLDAAKKLYQKLNPEMSETIKLAKELGVTELQADKILTDLYKKQELEYKQKQKLIEQQNNFQSTILYTIEYLEQNAESFGWATEAVANNTGALEVSLSTREKVREGFLTFNDVVQASISALSDLGMEQNEITSGIGDIASGIASMASGNYIAAAASIISGVTSVLKGLTEPDWGARAKKALGGFEGVTDEMQERLEQLSKELGNTEAAFRSLLAEFIESAEITSFEGFEKWAQEIVKLQEEFQELIQDAENYQKIINELEEANSYMADKLLEEMPKIDETAQQIEDSFRSIVGQAQRLGYEGSKAMLEIIENAKELRKQGYEMASVTEYIESQLKDGINALGSYLQESADVARKIAETKEKLAGLDSNSEEWAAANEELAKLKEQFGNVSNEESFNRALTYAAGFMSSLQAEGKSMLEIVAQMGPQLDNLKAIADTGGYDTTGLSELLKLRKFVTDNQEVMNSIDASKKMLESFGNTGYLTSDMFKSFQSDARDYYQKLTADGKNQKEAMQAMLPYLSQLKWYSEQNNLELDEHTKKLLKDAEAAGYNLDGMKSQQQLQQEMNSSMKDLVDIMSKFTGITAGATQGLAKMANTATQGFHQAAAGAKNLAKNVGALNNTTPPPPPAPSLPPPKDIPGFATGTDGWRKVTKETIFKVGEGGQEEYLNVVTKAQAAEKAKKAQAAQERIMKAQIAEFDKLANVQTAQTASKKAAGIDAGKQYRLRQANDAIRQKAESDFEKADVRIESKTPALPAVPPLNVNVSAPPQGDRNVNLQVTFQNESNVRVDNQGSDMLADDDRFARGMKVAFQNNAEEVVDVIFSKIKERKQELTDG